MNDLHVQKGQLSEIECEPVKTRLAEAPEYALLWSALSGHVTCLRP